jgi:SAM-dependent methyltransferase
VSVNLNFGCGDNKLKDWQNFDSEVDIAKRLPFKDNYADFILAEHVVEHVDYYTAIKFFQECRRVLKPDAIVRIAVPAVDRIYRLSDADYWKFTTKFQPDSTLRGAVYSILFCHGHKTAWTQDLLEVTLFYAGFASVQAHTPGKSTNATLCGVEGHAKEIGIAWNLLETVVCEGVCQK